MQGIVNILTQRTVVWSGDEFTTGLVSIFSLSMYEEVGRL